LTPQTGTFRPGFLPARRAHERRPFSERVAFQREGHTVLGWALNISRGGLRAILEEQVDLGAVFDIALGDAQDTRQGRIVWVQEEPDGAIVGVAFLDAGAADSVPAPFSEPAQPPSRGSRPGTAPREEASERTAT
jgi:hypothetical protein